MPRTKRGTMYVDYSISKLNPLDLYLKENLVTRYKLHKISGITEMTLSNASKRKVENLEAKYFIYIGALVHKKPGFVLDEMIKIQDELDEQLDKLDPKYM